MQDNLAIIEQAVGFDLRKLGLSGPAATAFRLDDDLETRLAELLCLPQGWDGYRGMPTAPQVADRVRASLARCQRADGVSPAIVPGSDGDVQLEWHAGGIDLEIAIDQSNAVQVWFRTGNTHPEGLSLTLLQSV